MKINKNKTITAGMVTLLLATASVTTINYHNLNKEIEVKNQVINTYKKESKENTKDLKEFKESKLFMEMKQKELEEDVSKLDSDNNKLKEENKKLKEFYEKASMLPKWNPDNVSQKSNVSVVGLSMALKGTGLEGLEESFIEAEKEYGVNAIFLTSLVAQESGWGGSDRAKRQNNLSGYAVYHDNSEGKTFESKHDSIMGTAKLLKDHYIGEGLYDIASINNKYSADMDWKNGITSIANEMIDNSNVGKYIPIGL